MQGWHKSRYELAGLNLWGNLTWKVYSTLGKQKKKNLMSFILTVVNMIFTSEQRWMVEEEGKQQLFQYREKWQLNPTGNSLLMGFYYS